MSEIVEHPKFSPTLPRDGGAAKSGLRAFFQAHGAEQQSPLLGLGRDLWLALHHRLTATTSALVIVAVATVLRLTLAVVLPLSFDESYFWLWSKHLALSYYDHPPMIALAIRAGTILLGDTPIGVRFVPLLASIVASWALWRAAATIFNSRRAAALAVCLFNLTLMTAVVSASATPDSLLLAAACVLLLAVAKLEAGGGGQWWLAIGAAIGFSLLTKYTALFLAGGVGLWSLGTPQGRLWLRSGWPYVAALIAAACTVSTLEWNAQHDWISFAFQFGRVTEGGFRPGTLLEFVGGQLALVSPFFMILAVAGLAFERRIINHASPLTFAAAVVLLTFGYFLLHALHDRVQGNWPSFAVPALILLATAVFVRQSPNPRLDGVLRLSRALALPTAAMILALCYVQAFFGVLAMGIYDPVARMTAVGVAPVAAQISALARRDHAAAIVTSKYVVSGWLAFYARPGIPLVQINEAPRWLSAPPARATLMHKTLLYVTQSPAKELRDVSRRFGEVKQLAVLTRERSGAIVDRFYVYEVSQFHGPVTGRVLMTGRRA